MHFDIRKFYNDNPCTFWNSVTWALWWFKPPAMSFYAQQLVQRKHRKHYWFFFSGMHRRYVYLRLKSSWDTLTALDQYNICRCLATLQSSNILIILRNEYIDGILPKGPYPPCLRMADRALLAGYPRYQFKQTMFKRVGAVDDPLVSLLLTGPSSNTPCYVNNPVLSSQPMFPVVNFRSFGIAGKPYGLARIGEVTRKVVVILNLWYSIHFHH